MSILVQLEAYFGLVGGVFFEGGEGLHRFRIVVLYRFTRLSMYSGSMIKTPVFPAGFDRATSKYVGTNAAYVTFRVHALKPSLFLLAYRRATTFVRNLGCDHA